MRTDAAAGDRLLERALSSIDDGSPEYAEAVSLRGRSLLIAAVRPTPCHFLSVRSKRGGSLTSTTRLCRSLATCLWHTRGPVKQVKRPG